MAALVLEIPIISILACLLSKKQAPGSKLLMYMVVFSFLFTGGMIPTDMIVKGTGLMNSLSELVASILFAPYNIIILKNAMQRLSAELEESALLDGAGYVTLFLRIVMPLSKPVLATIAIWICVAQWNHYMIFMNKENISFPCSFGISRSAPQMPQASSFCSQIQMPSMPRCRF